LMYLILVVQFGSFSVPLSVMLSLPLSMTGVVASLWATGSTLNLMSFIGIIMLMGLVAKNAILLLDCARKREEAGEERRAALAYAGRQRLRPIMMTTCALIAGMLPIAIGLGEGGDFYRPLAIAIIGGTVTSTVLALLVVPTLYNGIESAREEALARYQARARRGSAVVAALMLLLEVALFWVPFKRFAPRGIPSGLP
jgi:multidrug efflux pump subunit AcrB